MRPNHVSPTTAVTIATVQPHSYSICFLDCSSFVADELDQRRGRDSILKFRGDINGPVDRSVDRALGLEDFVGSIDGIDFVFSRALQDEDHMDAAQYEHTAIGLDFAIRHGRQVAFARRDPARLQRATQGAEQSPTGCRDHVVDRRCVRLDDLAQDAVVTRDRAVRPEAHRVGSVGICARRNGPLTRVSGISDL